MNLENSHVMNDYIETRLDFTRSVGAVPETGCVVDMETATDIMASFSLVALRYRL